MRKNIFISLFVALMFIAPGCAIAFIDGRDSALVALAFVFIIVQSVGFIFIAPGAGASLLKVYFVFSYIFFGVVPFLEYKNNIVYWGGLGFTDSIYLYGNAIIIVMNFLYFFSHQFFFREKNTSAKPTLKPRLILKKNASLALIGTLVVFSFLSFLVVFYINNFSFLSLLFRGGEYKEAVEVSQTVSLILGTVFRFMPVAIFTYFYLEYEADWLTKMVLLGLALLSAFPLGMARFAVAALYIPIVLLFFQQLLVKNRFPFILMLSVVFVFPALEVFRNFNDDAVLEVWSRSFFFAGHFDSYQSLLRVLSENFITNGRQLLGVFFFFVPRSVWPDKPIGSGAEIARSYGLSFENISANYYAEGFVNFGVFGCLLFVFVLAYITAKFDKKYWVLNPSPFFIIFYYCMLGYMHFFLRGDLMSAFSFAVSLFISYYLVSRVFLLFRRF